MKNTNDLLIQKKISELAGLVYMLNDNGDFNLVFEFHGYVDEFNIKLIALNGINVDFSNYFNASNSNFIDSYSSMKITVENLNLAIQNLEPALNKLISDREKNKKQNVIDSINKKKREIAELEKSLW